MTKIVITDYPRVLDRDLEYEVNRIKVLLGDVEISIVPYENYSRWSNQVAGAEAILTAFLPMDKKVMEDLPKLKCIVLNASGYDNVDVEEATRRGVAVIPIEEYCTLEVAEHTIGVLIALARGIKHYQNEIDNDKTWSYTSMPGIKRIYGKTLGITGFGKIGQRVGHIANALGMQILVYARSDKRINSLPYPVTYVTKEELFRRSDFISNHMAYEKKDKPFYDEDAFKMMERKPVFLNMGRGGAVDERSLVKALDNGWISGAGLDVLASESPELDSNPLVGRDNVIITPHSAFYSEESIKALQDISCDNLAYYLLREYEKVHRIVNISVCE